MIIDIIIQIMPSSVVDTIRYDPHSSTLRIIFVSGTVYDYKKVPQHVYEEMKTAASKGKYLNEFIKGKYDFEKLE